MPGICYQFSGTGQCRFGEDCKFRHVAGSGESYTVPAPSNTPLATFFAIYEPEFYYDLSASATDEFKRLCEVQEWDEEEDGEWSQAHGAAYARFKDALVQQFNATYGTDVNSLTSWQALVGAVGIDPIPNSLDECQAIILGLHVNLVDLVDAREDGPNTTVELFDSLQSLRTYTIEEEKFFPKENAYSSGLLRFLLREILTGYKGSHRLRSQKSKRRRR